jgi:hypothetical protein
MNGNPIPINYSSFITQVQAVGGSDIAVNITRSASRLKTVFLSFNGAYPTARRYEVDQKNYTQRLEFVLPSHDVR